MRSMHMVLVVALAATLTGLAPEARSQAGATRLTVEPNWAAIVAAAKKEGKVVVYASPTSAVVDRVVAGFKKAYCQTNSVVSHRFSEEIDLV